MAEYNGKKMADSGHVTLTPTTIDLEALLINETQAISELRADVRELKVNFANPGPMGLFSFGLTTVLAMMTTSGAVNGATKTILQAHGIFHGGLLQLIAGLLEFRKGNLFPATVFCSYGVFWLVDMGIQFLTFVDPETWVMHKSGKALWLSEWALITCLLGVCTLRTNRVLQAIFLVLFCAFCLLAGGVYNRGVEKAGAVMGLIAGLLAIYLAFAEFSRDIYQREIVPMWVVKKKGN